MLRRNQEDTMTTVADPISAGLPLPPAAHWTLRRRLDSLTRFHLAGEWLRDEVGPVAFFGIGPERLGPRLAPRFVMVSSAQGAHDVLAGADGSVDKYGAIHEELRKFGSNIFNLPHDEWLPRKRALQPVFTKPRMTSYAGAMSDVAVEVGAGWAAAGRVDLQDATRALTTEVLGRSLLGIRLAERAPRLAADFDVFAGYAMSRARRPVKAPLWLPTPARARFRSAWDAMAVVADGAIDRVRRDPDIDAPLIHQMLAARDPETGHPLDDEALVADLVVFLLAGHDTTATTLAYALWQLGRHPGLQASVAEEAAAIGTRTLTPDDVTALPQSVRVLHEALRLCPPGAAVSRQAMRDVVVDGHRIPAGWNLLVNIYALHRDPAAWPEPERFDPDRFLPDRSEGRSRWQFLPFGGGQRKCIGDHFAMLEATVALATLVRDLEFTSEGDFEIEVGFTTRSAVPVPVRVHAR
jgi:cytochrome P450